MSFELCENQFFYVPYERMVQRYGSTRKPNTFGSCCSNAQSLKCPLVSINTIDKIEFTIELGLPFRFIGKGQRDF